MSAEFFIDTNVFIYHLDITDRRKHKTAEQIVRQALATGNACISSQVVQECLNVALRKAEVALPAEAARSYLDAVLAPLMQVTASEALFHRALDVQARWRFGFYDSLIVAGAMTAGCRTLLSEDLQHGQNLGSLTVVDPFR
ncbi:MAG: PIN domain-containing protein [Rubrivivax sp.]|nr:PIN domain-containing protein [Rubrivivax sp.]